MNVTIDLGPSVQKQRESAFGDEPGFCDCMDETGTSFEAQRRQLTVDERLPSAQAQKAVQRLLKKRLLLDQVEFKVIDADIVLQADLVGPFRPLQPYHTVGALLGHLSQLLCRFALGCIVSVPSALFALAAFDS